MRILQLIPTLRVGGLERVATTLTLALAAGGDDVVVATSGPDVYRSLLDELAVARVPVARIPRPRRGPRELAAAAHGVADVLRRERPDILHAHNPAAAVAAVLARRLARQPALPIVTTYHGLASGGTWTAVLALRATSDLVVAIGPAAQRELARSGLPERKTAVVMNAVATGARRLPVEVRRELGVGPDDELVVTVGRFEAEKDQALLLEASALLAPSRPRLRVRLVGVGALEGALQRRIESLGLEGLAAVAGYRADAIDVAAAAEVATLTSTREGLGLSLIEAMVAGTPVVATAVGGIVDVVEDGRTGLLVPPRRADALAAAIARILDDPAFGERLAAAAREEVAARFSVEAMVAGYRAAYGRALESRRRARARRTGERPSK